MLASATVRARSKHRTQSGSIVLCPMAHVRNELAETVMITCGEDAFRAEDEWWFKNAPHIKSAYNLTLPGGHYWLYQALISPESGAGWALDLLKSYLGQGHVRRIVIHGHAQCGHYVRAYPHAKRIDRMNMDQMRFLKKEIPRIFPGLTVEIAFKKSVEFDENVVKCGFINL